MNGKLLSLNLRNRRVWFSFLFDHNRKIMPRAVLTRKDLLSVPVGSRPYVEN